MGRTEQPISGWGCAAGAAIVGRPHGTPLLNLSELVARCRTYATSLTLAVPLLLEAVVPGWGQFPQVGWALEVPEAVCAAMLLGGLWMPCAGSAVTGIKLVLPLFESGAGDICRTRAAVALSLVLLGPGAWSVDTRLYGRKRIDI